MFIVDGDVVTVTPDQQCPDFMAPGWNDVYDSTKERCAAGARCHGLVRWSDGTPSCPGTYPPRYCRRCLSGSSLNSTSRDRSKRNLMLGNKFLTGMREAGVVVGGRLVLSHDHVTAGGDVIRSGTWRRNATIRVRRPGRRRQAADAAGDADDGDDGVSICPAAQPLLVVRWTRRQVRARASRGLPRCDAGWPSLMRVVWLRSWGVSSAARWGRGWSGRRSNGSVQSPVVTPNHKLGP